VEAPEPKLGTTAEILARNPYHHINPWIVPLAERPSSRSTFLGVTLGLFAVFVLQKLMNPYLHLTTPSTINREHEAAVEEKRLRNAADPFKRHKVGRNIRDENL